MMKVPDQQQIAKAKTVQQELGKKIRRHKRILKRTLQDHFLDQIQIKDHLIEEEEEGQAPSYSPGMY